MDLPNLANSHRSLIMKSSSASLVTCDSLNGCGKLGVWKKCQQSSLPKQLTVHIFANTGNQHHFLPRGNQNCSLIGRILQRQEIIIGTNFIAIDSLSSNRRKGQKTMLTSLVFIWILFAKTFEHCKAGYMANEKGL